MTPQIHSSILQPSINTQVRRKQLIGALALVGGALIIAGTLLPWFSLFAGLQPYSGVVGLNGRLLLAGGVVSSIAGGYFFFRSSPKLHWAIGLFGFLLLACSGALLLQLLLTYRTLAANPLIVAALGPGLFVVLVGAALVFGTLFVSYQPAPQTRLD